MASNFTTGIPEIDRLTGNKIGNGSFLLIRGNDDEGMSAFLTEIEKSNGRTVGEEKTKANGCLIQKVSPCGKITGIESNNCFKQPQKTETFSRTKTDNELERIIFIENISELFQNQTNLEKYPVKNVEKQIISLREEIK